MSLRELLSGLVVDELKDIARTYSMKGYSSMKKDELVGIVAARLEALGDDFYDEMIKGLSPSQKYLAWLLSKKTNGTSLSNPLQAEFLEKFTRKTYAAALDSLLSMGLVFLQWNEDKSDDSLLIATEMLPGLRKAVKGLVFDESREESQSVEKVEGMGDILLELSNDELSAFCVANELPKTGTKEQLVKRILDADLPPDDVLDLPSKPVLKWACEVLGCKVGGSKDELKSRVLEKLSIGQASKSAAPRKKAKPAPKKEEAPPEKPKQVPLVEGVFGSLKTIYIDYHGIADEDSLAASIATVLMNNAELRQNDIKITRGSTSQKDNKKQPDLVLTKDAERIFVESKYIDQKHPTNTIRDAKEQFFNFSSDFGQAGGIFFFYDRDGKMPEQDIDNFKKQCQGKVIYKTLDDSNK